MSCKVNSEWFEKYIELKDGTKVQYKDFMTKKNDFQINCLACNCAINVKHKGFAAVTQHTGRDKHGTNMEIKFNKNQSKFEAVKPSEQSSNANTDMRLFIPTTKEATT